MTRQKTDLIKKIEEIERFIDVDMKLGCGLAPPDVYAELENEIWRPRE